MNIEPVIPLKDFLRNHKKHVARLRKTKKPEALSVNGRPEMVLMDARTYKKLVKRMAKMESLAAIREGLEADARGDVKPAEQFFAELRARYGIPD